DRATLQEKLRKETPFVLQTKEKAGAMQGVYLFEGECRYSGVAQHLLGYLDQGNEVGLSGVEKEYNDYLNLFSTTVSVKYNGDALQGMMAGLGVQKTESQPTQNGLVLTLNAALCEALEEALDGQIKKGAALVLDCHTGEIKAAASRPGYDEHSILTYLDSEEGELVNRCFAGQTVGSVFKIILAACALEAGLEDFKFECGGGIVIGDLSFACHQHSGHGAIGLKEAFSQSCNVYFIALGQLLGYDRIAEMSKRFGYNEAISILGSMTASAGNYPAKSSNMALANLSIGQGDLLASPLQIARMTAVIANGGFLTEASLYRGIYLNGALKTDGEIKGSKQILSTEIAEKLQEYCVYTVESGTGKAAKPNAGSAGGKTASAQTGVLENGKEKLNVYFTGFYPAEDPQYVITVFAEDGESGGQTCGPVFREICDFMAENGLTASKTVVY
ncbi:MAG: penicillin-binding protein 2, partial [Clostridia bacterium]|nr:penicillin-binding protein 2 [Clostridia bacterium]